MVKWLHRSLYTEQATHTQKQNNSLLCCAYQGRKVVLEEFSGIPVKALLENDEKTTALYLSESGCGVTEACVLAECLKVFLFSGVAGSAKFPHLLCYCASPPH